MFSLNSAAQNECSVILREAQDEFDAGNLDAVIEMLYPCIETGFNKNEKVQAYRLIALTFLFDDKIDQAKATMYELLKLNPEFEINEVVDPIEFKELHKKFITYPIFSYGFIAGLNFTKVNLRETYGVDNFESSGIYSSNGIGYQFGAHGAVVIKPRFYANLEVFFKGTKFQFNDNLEFHSFMSNQDTLSAFGTLQSNENHSWLSIPFSLTYDFPLNKKMLTYARLGATSNLLLSAQSTLDRRYEEKYSLPNISRGAVNMKDNRNDLNFWLTAGTGIKYKIPRGNLFFDIRYNHALKKANDPTARYSNPELLYQYFYVDDDFKMSDLCFSIGYTRHIYDPKIKGENIHDLVKNKTAESNGVKSNTKGTRYKKFK